MKRMLILILALALCFSMAACGSDKDVQNPSPEPKESESGITVDEGLIYVDITLPASLFDSNMVDFDADEYAAENGFKKAVLNSDGSVTITITKARHKELLQEMEANILTTFDELIEAEDTPYIKAIEFTKDFHTITIKVDKAGYESTFLDLTPFIVGMSAMFYQVFLNEESRVEVITKDVDTGEILNTAVYPDALNGT